MYLTVGEISKALGISTEANCYYVKEGIITPKRNEENNYWVYSSEDLMKLTDIMFYRSMGLTMKDIKDIMSGLALQEIAGVIETRKNELIGEIKERVDALHSLTNWEDEYRSELLLLGKFQIGSMPAEFRRPGCFEEASHMVWYLQECFDFDKEDWGSVSMSFYYDLNEEAPKLKRYLSVAGIQKLSPSNLSESAILEQEDYCLITEVHYSSQPLEMIQPMLDYAADQGIKLTGIFYGREDTNYYVGGARRGLYKIYAPIHIQRKGKK